MLYYLKEASPFVLDAQTPRIAGTTMKVMELILAKEAYGWSAEELHFQYPSLSLGQIYSALAYYADHRNTLDENIARRLAKVQSIQQSTPRSPLRARFQNQGLL